ncbi:MAG: C25 family cysteine peptidase, partial [Myxococcota bacterium]
SLNLRFVPDGTTTIVIPPNPTAGTSGVEEDRYDIVVRYIVGVDYESVSGPVFFTGRGESGTFARWASETTPDNASFDPVDFMGLTTLGNRGVGVDPRFGPPGGSSGSDDSEGGTSTSSDGSSGTDASLATVENVRLLRAGDETVVEFVTRSEINSGAFEVLMQSDNEWQKLGQTILARPDRSAAIYRERIDQPEDSLTLLIREYELGGQTREYGPFEVDVESTGVLPEMAGEDTYSVARARQLEPLPPSLRGLDAASPGTRARFGIDEAGIYRVDYAELAQVLNAGAAEIAMRATTGQLRVSSRLSEVPYSAASDGIEFWATPILDEQTSSPPYMVSLAPGSRILERDAAPAATDAVPSARARLFFEEDVLPAPATDSFRGSSFWMWRFLLAGSPPDGTTEFVFDAPNVVDGPASAVLRLRGGSTAPVFPNHEVSVSLNDTEILRRGFFGFDSRSEFIELPNGLLRESDNILSVTAIRRNGVPFSVVWVDSFDVNYQQQPQASGGLARFGANGESVLSASGFDTSNVRVWQLDGSRVTELTGVDVSSGSSTGAITFSNGSARGTEYVAFAPSAVRELTGLMPIRDVDVRVDTLGAEYVVVAHPDFMEGANALAEYRNLQRLSTRVVDVFDLYATFTDGRVEARALEDFVRFAHTQWQEQPRYIVLIGD